MSRNTYIIGIDEAGRGPLAGPVVVAGVRAPRSIQRIWRRRGIRDSKKLSPRKREAWFQFLTVHSRIEWAAARVGAGVIDRINIARSADLGARRVYARLCAKLSPVAGLSLAQTQVVQLDGGLKLPQNIAHQTIIKGDEKIPAIAAASIIAKVTRDRLMLRLHNKYPQYRFDLHKGYGTKLHKKLLCQFGRCGIHRISFRY